MHFSALRSLTQPLLDCILYLTLTPYPYDPGTLPSSANQCILGNVYLRSNLSRKWFQTVPGKTLASLTEPCRSMQSVHCLCKLFPPFASVPRPCCVRGLQSIKDQHVRRVRCGRKPICWGRVHAQVRLCIPKAVARPVHLMLK